MGREYFFPKNAFHWGINFVGKIYGGIALHGGTNDQITPKGDGVSQNVFSSDLNNVNLKISPNHVRILT